MQSPGGAWHAQPGFELACSAGDRAAMPAMRRLSRLVSDSSLGALYGGVNGGASTACNTFRHQTPGLATRGAAGAMDAPSAFESAPTDPTMAVAYESCGPVLQVGEAFWAGKDVGRSQDSFPASGATTMAL